MVLQIKQLNTETTKIENKRIENKNTDISDNL
jgi:hypothetical protein